MQHPRHLINNLENEKRSLNAEQDDVLARLMAFGPLTANARGRLIITTEQKMLLERSRVLELRNQDIISAIIEIHESRQGGPQIY